MKYNYNIFFSIFVLGQLWWLVGWSHLCGACSPCSSACLVLHYCHQTQVGEVWLPQPGELLCMVAGVLGAGWWEQALPSRVLVLLAHVVPHMPAHQFSVSWAGTLHSLELGHPDPHLHTPTQGAFWTGPMLSLCWLLAFSPGGELGPSSVFSSLMDHHPWSSSIQCLKTTVLYIPCFFSVVSGGRVNPDLIALSWP